MDTVKNKLRRLLNSKTKEQLIEEDADILMANYLSEIERIFSNEGINKKELSKMIEISPSYLTQVFRGDKPLNFITIAKIKRALNLKIKVKIFSASEQKVPRYEITSKIKTIDNFIPKEMLDASLLNGIYNENYKGITNEQNYFLAAS